jgi:RNA polymerase sigma-70 factor (ECF subfamily)
MEHAREELVALLPQLRGFARSLTGGDSHFADDLVQDTVVLALRSWHSFQPGTSLKSWLLKILHNRFHSQMRRKYKSAEVVREDLANLSWVPSSQHVGLEVDAFKGAFKALKPEHRAVLVLSAVHGLSYEAIAEICRCQVGTVKSRISRARSQLKAMLAGEDADAVAPAPRAAPARLAVRNRVMPPAPAAAPPQPPIGLARPAAPVRPRSQTLLQQLAETERQIVGLELRLTRCRSIATRLDLAWASPDLSAGLVAIAEQHLSLLHTRRRRLLAAAPPTRAAA